MMDGQKVTGHKGWVEGDLSKVNKEDVWQSVTLPQTRTHSHTLVLLFITHHVWTKLKEKAQLWLNFFLRRYYGFGCMAPRRTLKFLSPIQQPPLEPLAEKWSLVDHGMTLGNSWDRWTIAGWAGPVLNSYDKRVHRLNVIHQNHAPQLMMGASLRFLLYLVSVRNIWTTPDFIFALKLSMLMVQTSPRMCELVWLTNLWKPSSAVGMRGPTEPWLRRCSTILKTP